MKSPLYRLKALALLVAAAHALPSLAAGPTATVRVEAQGFRNASGGVGCVLFNQAEGFPDLEEKAFRTVRVAVDQGRAVCEFTQVPEGTYAVAVVHDENRNRKLDKNFLGIPQEGWGVSNNVRPSMSAPKFEEAAFALQPGASKVLTIKIGY
ncbi:MAG: hypothetical protein RI988_2094 [Pseudomonadota bacterium]|jgi:uncharacterized protein (DUF2141 family)